jgi:uncharacterized protein (TIGR02996 family)
MADGDEAQERYCYDCRHMEDRLRSQGGVSWYAEDPPHRMHTAQGIEATLLAQIRAAPDDDAPRSIYADWLIERGDPLGTFIALQLARAQKRDPLVSDEEQRLLDAHWGAWIGPPAETFEVEEDVAFERGFWSMARMRTLRQFDAIERHRPLVPLEELELVDIPGAPQILEGRRSLTASSLAHLRRLSVHCLPDFAPRWIDRAHAANIGDLTLIAGLNDADIRAAIGRARTTRLMRIAFVTATLAYRAERETDGSFLIRALVLQDPFIADVKRTIGLLGEVVAPDVKLEIRDLRALDAQAADQLGLRLVKHVPRCTASPKR